MPGNHSILYLVTSSGWGGAERYVAMLAKVAMTLGEVHVIAGPGDGSLFEKLPHEAFVMRSKHLKRRVSPLADIRAMAELRRYMEKNDIDIVHANSTKSGLIASLATRGMKKKPRIIYTAHGWAFLETDRSPLFRMLTGLSERFASRFRDATIVLSEMERRIALERGLSDEAHLCLIPLGIPKRSGDFLSRNESRDILLKNTREGFIFGTIANAYPPKSLPILVSAFEHVAENHHDVKLVIIGDGPSMPKLRGLHERSRYRERIFLPGRLPDAARFLKAFDAFVLSSSKEGMPWSVLEASQARLPIITTRVGALPEMIRNEETGLLVPPHDPQALAVAMMRVAEDEALRAKLKNGSPHIAETHPEIRMIQKTLKVYWNEA